VRFWEVHRHRLAPAAAERVATMVNTGRLQVLAGVVEDCRDRAGGVDVVVRRRGSQAGHQTLRVGRVVNCTGPQQRLAEANDPLLDSLFASGAARPGAYGLGLDVDAEGAVVARDGRSSRALWAIGPLRRGADWETTAVREIRLQAVALAAHLAGPSTSTRLELPLHDGEPPPVRPSPAIRVEALEVPGLGNHCNIASDGRIAVVIDPPRDIDRCLALAGRLGGRIAWVLETHVHNDYVSGGLELARVTGARYGLAAAEDVGFVNEWTGLRDGDVIQAGAMQIRVVHTPGHTEHHLAYVLIDAATGLPVAVFTGGSWLHGAAGRTDLLGADKTVMLARAQWRSIRQLAAQLPDAVEIRPTHGFGSFCAAGSSPDEGGGPATVGAARSSHPALLLGEQPFVRHLLAGHTAYPSYYAHMAPINRAGPAPIDLRPAPAVDPRELPARMAGGEWFVDLRPRQRFAAAHLSGSLNLEGGDSLATYLGWLLPWGTPVTLGGEDATVVSGVQRAMARIGIDRPAAQLTGPFDGWAGAAGLRSYPVARFTDLATQRHPGTAPRIVDVRRDDEWTTAHLAGACHIPLPDLAQHLDEISRLGEAGPLWVHCASGFRAAIAASWLDARGFAVVLLDDSLASAALAGLELVTPRAPQRRPAASSKPPAARISLSAATVSGARR
jgi:glyoxylase-like metal-dependent hydrolase (beta-lactamase superfamily II)/rhodanese-related sulfurtransferase